MCSRKDQCDQRVFEKLEDIQRLNLKRKQNWGEVRYTVDMKPNTGLAAYHSENQTRETGAGEKESALFKHQ